MRWKKLSMVAKQGFFINHKKRMKAEGFEKPSIVLIIIQRLIKTLVRLGNFNLVSIVWRTRCLLAVAVGIVSSISPQPAIAKVDLMESEWFWAVADCLFSGTVWYCHRYAPSLFPVLRSMDLEAATLSPQSYAAFSINKSKCFIVLSISNFCVISSEIFSHFKIKVFHPPKKENSQRELGACRGRTWIEIHGEK